MSLPSDESTASVDVMYVEDEPSNAVLMGALFGMRRHLRLHVATNGAEALLMAGRLRPSLLLLDQRLPDCRGTDLLPLLREQFPHLRQVPAIAVTAEPHFDPAAFGFDELWAKPMNLHAVLGSLDHWLPHGGPGARRPHDDGALQSRAAPRIVSSMQFALG